MQAKIVIFFHGVFQIEGRTLPAAIPIIREQMKALKESGLLEAATEMHVGLNDTIENMSLAHDIFPKEALVHFHGQQCRNELRSLLLLESLVNNRHNWRLSPISQNPNEEWLCLWFHAKGASHPIGHELSTRWRGCMQKHLVTNWRQCVKDLETVESVGVHFMEPPATPATQYIWAGNFWWSRNSFLKTLPSVMERERIKISGIDSLESRFEAEVFIGNGPRPPTHIDYHGPNWTPAKVSTCRP